MHSVVKTHPSELELDQYRSRELQGRDLISIGNHIAWCGECRVRIARANAMTALLRAEAYELDNALAP